MDLNRFTEKTQQALSAAQGLAMRSGHVETDAEHLLLALIEQPEGLFPRLLTKLDVEPEALANKVRESIQRRPSVAGPGAEPGKIFLSQRLSRLLLAAEAEA